MAGGQLDADEPDRPVPRVARRGRIADPLESPRLGEEPVDPRLSLAGASGCLPDDVDALARGLREVLLEQVGRGLGLAARRAELDAEVAREARDDDQGGREVATQASTTRPRRR